jgi:plasmid stabilization system protein ParE
LGELNWTKEAETWLKDIYDYVAADNPAAAVGTVNGIYEEARLLRQHPEADTNTRLNHLATSEFFSIVIIESRI